MIGLPRLLVLFVAGALVVVGAVSALSSQSWWLLAVAFVVFLAVVAVVMVPIGRSLSEGDKPDPVTEARLEAEDGAGEAPPGPGERGGSAR